MLKGKGDDLPFLPAGEASFLLLARNSIPYFGGYAAVIGHVTIGLRPTLAKAGVIMAKKKIDTVRVRVGFPASAWARIERLAAAMEVDAPTLVRVLASAQLVQMEALTINAGQLGGKNEQQVIEHLDREAVDLFPEGQLKPEPESEPEPEQKRDFGLRPRGELDEHSSFDLLAGALAYR